MTRFGTEATMTRAREKTREKLYYSISEVSDAAEVKPHVLRYWETQFKMLRPKKNRAGNRMYRPRDLNLVLTIRDLLYRNGYTIAGARRKLIDSKRTGELTNGQLGATDGESTSEESGEVSTNQLTLADGARLRAVSEVKNELTSLLKLLESR